MQIPQPHINIKVGNLFRRIYKDKEINLDVSRNSLAKQLKFYLEHFGKHIGNKISQKDNKRIWDIIERNNAVFRILESRNFRKLTKRQEQLLGNTALGLVFCFKSERSYLLKSPCKSDHINDGATVITSKVIAKGYNTIRVARLNGCFLVISSFCCKATE